MKKNHNKSMSKDYKRRTITDLILTLRYLESAYLALESAPLCDFNADDVTDQIEGMIYSYAFQAEHLIYDEKYPSSDNQKAYINSLRKLYSK